MVASVTTAQGKTALGVVVGNPMPTAADALRALYGALVESGYSVELAFKREARKARKDGPK